MIEPVRVTGEWRVYPFGGRFGENPGSGSPEQRLREQDIDGVEAEILYPGSQGPNFWRGIKEDAIFIRDFLKSASPSVTRHLH